MWLKWTKRILAGIGIFIVLIIAFFLSVVYIYEDEVKQFAVEQLNKNLKVKVKAPEIDLTLWDQFPNASLRFNNVLIPDYLDSSGQDTMFYAKHIYLSFDFWDMMGGNYKVQTVSLESAIANIRINKDGVGNYDIFKKDTTEKNASKFSFELKKLTGKDLRISYVDSVNQQVYRTHNENITFTGDFSDEAFIMKVKSDMKLKKIHTNNITFIRNKNASLELELNINNKEAKYEISKGDLNIEELLFNIKGTYSNKPDSARVDLNIKGKNIDLASAFTILPKDYTSSLEQYKAKGLVVFEANINGLINEQESPRTVAEFYLKDGSLEEQTSLVTLKNLSLDGVFDSNKNGISILNIKDINGTIDVGVIKGNILVENLSNPIITVNTHGEINLLQLKYFANSSNIEKLSGLSKFDAYFKAQRKNNDIQIVKSNGTFSFLNTTLKLPSSPITYSQINGDLALKQNDAAISNLHGFAGDSDFRLDGVLKNLIPYILSSEETLTVEADLRTQKLNLDELLVEDKKSKAIAFNTEKPTPFILPSNINLNLKAQIEELTYGKFNTKKINGIITLYNQKLTAKNFKFKANKGDYMCTTDIQQNPDNTFEWTTALTAKDIDIENFFAEMDNFGQVYITDQNIKGKGNITLDMAVLMANDFTIDQKSLIADINLHLYKGELINQSSMLEIADYLNSNKIVKAFIDTEKMKKKMDHIKFSDLSNTITIKNSQILIPKMLIESNLMDVSIAGAHNFNDDIDYHFSFTLRDLYYKNANQDEFGPIVDDELGKRLFLRMFGNLSDPQYEIDSEEKHQALKENMEQEKKDVKSLLKSELGLFKKDSTVGNYVEPKKTEPTFEIEWEEFDEKESSNPNTKNASEDKSSEKKKKDKGINKFLKKLGVEEEKKADVKLEIDSNP